jgi:hypothetical protein
LYGLDLSHIIYMYYYCSVSRKNLQEAFGKDYTHEKVDAIMRVSVVVYMLCLSFWFVANLMYSTRFVVVDRIRHRTRTRMGKYPTLNS